jgi:D-alanine-D-alanine ligase
MKLGTAIGIVYNEPVRTGFDFSEASLDVLTQVEAVEKAIGGMGFESLRIPFTRNLRSFLHEIHRKGIGMVFNLCETVDENPLFAGHPASVLELLAIPFSGSPSIALMLTTDKLLTKRFLEATGIRTPRYLVYDDQNSFFSHALEYPVIVKPRFEDASIGIGQESIFSKEGHLRRGLPEFFERFGTLLVEEYVEGREFNISLLGYPLPRVLPFAEIDFSDFPESLYKIVGYQAKWDRESFEYQHTPRRFSQELPQALMREIEKTALDAFRLFMLRDYGRVDMRVDGYGRVFVLEVNANPCLSPDAGFASTIEEAGLSYSDFISLLIDFMTKRTASDGYQAPCLSRYG